MFIYRYSHTGVSVDLITSLNNYRMNVYGYAWTRIMDTSRHTHMEKTIVFIIFTVHRSQQNTLNILNISKIVILIQASV